MNAKSENSFEIQITDYEKELRLHCYRLTGSLQDAEDLLQETFLRAWKKRDTLREDSKIRPWLYRIATNACFDHLRTQSRRELPTKLFPPTSPSEFLSPPANEYPWPEPFPDSLLPEKVNLPEAAIISREEMSLAFITAIQLLSHIQRAAVIFIDVLDWSAEETAEALGKSKSSINGLLYRARKKLKENSKGISLDVLTDKEEKALLEKYLSAWEHSDIDEFGKLLQRDAIFHMPPFPNWYDGRSAILEMVNQYLFDPANPKQWRLDQYYANRQPAPLLSRWNKNTGTYELFGMMMIRIDGDNVAEIVVFLDAKLFSFFQS